MATMISLFADWSTSTTGYCVFTYDGSTTSVTLSISGGFISSYDIPGGHANFGGLSPSTSYTVTATANPGGNTLSSSFTTSSGGGPVDPPDPVPAGSVSSLAATPHDGYVHLVWSAGSDATFYRIYYKRDGGSLGDMKTTDVGNVLSTDITDVTNGLRYSFFVEAWNSDGHGGASPVRYATPNPGRPSNFNWSYTTVSSGYPCGMDHRDWNFFTARINMFRNYAIDPDTGDVYGSYGFTTAPVGTFQAFYYRQAVTAIFEMSPPSAVPFLHYTDDYVYAWEVDQLRIALNSIP